MPAAKSAATARVTRLSAFALSFVLGSAFAVAVPTAGAATPQGPAAVLQVVSNRADLISGDDALVEAVLPDGVKPSAVTVRLNGRDITARFGKRANGRFMGLVTHLKLGDNTLTARIPGHAAASTTIVNHPNGGPVFSGPQLQPWTCLNPKAVDAQCNQPAEYTWQYLSTNPAKNGLQDYDPAKPATDVADTTTDQGVTVPFIVRVETGYQDRDQYRIKVLYQADKGWKPWAPQEQWNGKLLVTHGSSCNVDYQTGTAPDGEVVIPGVNTSSAEVALGRGFVVMSTALSHNAHNCNIALQAESIMMAKERVIEAYGPLRYTIGTGCSGGSLVEQQVANAYPGMYQGILPTCSFPDTWTSATQVMDYHLLRSYFENPLKWGLGVVWSPTQFGAVEGNLLPVDAIVSDVGFFNAIVPTHACGGVSDEQRYDPATNPGGVRCSIADAQINVFGPRLEHRWTANERLLGHGFAGIPVDNVGVQYGLSALQQGLILPSQFVDLNEKIGGLSIDIEPTVKRLSADRPALTRAYASGAINTASNLDQVAIIDGRGPDPGAAHDSYRAFAIRARLDREHGGHANHVIWEGPAPIIGDAKYAVNALIAMDRWLAAVEADGSDKPIARKIVDDKPADIGDSCWDGDGVKLTDALCGEVIVPVYGTPRTVAGDAITTDTNKCVLAPLEGTANYGPIPFTDAQWARLQKVFPNGVCDFSQPGQFSGPTVAWQTYQDAEGAVIYGGEPMKKAPRDSGTGWAGPAFGVFAR